MKSLDEHDMGVLNDAIKVYRDKGPSEVFQRGIGLTYRKTLRVFLPSIGFYTENCVNTKKRKLLDGAFYTPFSNSPD